MKQLTVQTARDKRNSNNSLIYKFGFKQLTR